jgi:hypothetical protein
MPTTDRRARLPLAAHAGELLLVREVWARHTRQRRPAKSWQRMRWYARRLAIARRRQRIAAQPRVGDRITDVWGEPWIVLEGNHRGAVIVRDSAGVRWPWSQAEWREEVRRARCTQEAA